MGTYTKAKTKRQLEHADSSSLGHKNDVLEARVRKRVSFVAVPATQADKSKPSLESAGLRGSERIHHSGGAVQDCARPEQLAEHLKREARERGWAYVERLKRGKRVTIRREVENPIEIVTVTAEPALNDYLWSEIRAGRNMESIMREISVKFVAHAKQLLVGDRERFLVAEAVHCDTHHWHIDLILSRQEDGIRVGKAGLQLGGPWLVGTDRQLRVNASISARKRLAFNRSVAEHKRRYGPESRPLDVQLARALDQCGREVIGAPLLSFRSAYAERVPLLEREHADREAAALSNARARLLDDGEPTVNHENHIQP